MDLDVEINNEGSFFQEKDETLSIIIDLVHADASIPIAERLFLRLRKILDFYQEQPQLIGPHCGELLEPVRLKLVSLINGEDESQSVAKLHNLGSIVYMLCKVRGFKLIGKELPHEVSQLRFALRLLEHAAQVNLEASDWEAVYLLSLWLGILCIVPFNMSTLESESTDDKTTESLSSRLILTFSKLLQSTGPVRDVAAYGLSNFLNRPDVFNTHLLSFVNWTISALQVQSQDSSRPYFFRLGALSAINQLLKRGDRERIITVVPILYEVAMQLDITINRSLERKLVCKVLQRLAVCLLPPQDATWRYQRGLRTLLDSSKTASKLYQPDSNCSASATAISEESVGEEIEEILGLMLKFLCDSDTVVRWSAAKGIGRICMRVPHSFAQDIVNAVLNCFEEERDDDAHWHGACLALAELSRRGLVLPEKLPDIIPYLEKALLFNVQKGQHGVGANVRDAACYVCWAFSRAYPAEDMYPIIHGLRMSLIITTMFDREINCRRAASAAFQEMVGRLGAEAIPYGIEVFTLADYVSVGNRSHSYLRIAPAVAILDPSIFCGPFLQFLIDRNCHHWDREIRELSSSAVGALIYRCKYPSISMLENLITYLDGGNPMFRHGSLLVLAKGVVAIRMIGQELSESFVQRMDALIPSLDKKRIFRGKGGELIREATCTLIESMARIRFPWQGKTLLSVVEILNENLRQPNEELQRKAQAALRQLLFHYFSEKNWKVEPTERLATLTRDKYLHGLLKENNVAVTRGYALALGVLPSRLALLPSQKFKEIIQALSDCADPRRKFNGERDAETNRNCVEALVELCERLLSNPYFSQDDFDLCFEAVIKAGSNYSTDKRGDTGSWSRLVALDGVVRIMESLAIRINLERNKHGTSKGFLTTVFGCGELISSKPITTSELALVYATYPSCTLGSKQASLDHDDYGYFQEESFDDTGSDRRQSCPICVTKCEALEALDTRRIFDETTGDENRKTWCCDDDETMLRLYLQSLSMAIRQLAEKLDNVRLAAAKSILRIIEFYSESWRIYSRSSVCETFVHLLEEWRQAGKPTSASSLSEASYSYDFVVRVMLDNHDLLGPALEGLVTSVGGITEVISVHSTAALLSACKQSESIMRFIENLFEKILSLFHLHRRKDRVILPLLKTLEILVTNNVHTALPVGVGNHFFCELLVRLKTEAENNSNIRKLCLLADLHSVVLQTGTHFDIDKDRCLLFLVEFLGHRFPKVRKYTSEIIYMQVLAKVISSVTVTDEEISDVLITTPWNGDDMILIMEKRELVAKAFSFEGQLCAEESAETKSSQRIRQQKDELDSYESLVREAGY